MMIIKSRLFFLIVFFLLHFINNSCSRAQNTNQKEMQEDFKYTNDLINESSPYLLQHAHNPVNWNSWGDEALKKAKDENKMLIISIGYSACHWCHVMEHESFEDPEVAKLMNDYFVPIKVDREERPDVDQIYMSAAQLISGRGGWPLNAFALPDGKPFYAGTYFPKNDWLKVLNYFIDAYKNKPETLTLQAEKITKGITSLDNVPPIITDTEFSIDDLNQIYKNFKPSIDFLKGGTNKSPKFPIPSVWEYMMYYAYLSKNEEALKAVTTTLDNMAYGGIYDHIGGGFARYSTDVNWHIPHFEKMLYDNAQLVILYSHAWQLTKNPLYKKIVFETLDFIKKEMTSPEGGFYSSLNADSDGEEGKYYAWTYNEIVKILGVNSKTFLDYYNITKTGNWENGKNILFKNINDSSFSEKYKISEEELHKIIDNDKIKLLTERNKRIKPSLDDKILTSWNSLMAKAYINAYMAFGETDFLDIAQKNINFLLKNSIKSDNEINRNYKNGKSSVYGFLDDYAFTISALIEMYQATFNEKWLYKANELCDYTKSRFFDIKSGLYFYTNNEHDNLISRSKEITDNVIPASNSQMAINL